MKQKLRILLVNKFYYPRGGDCISMINLEALLRRMGYEVAVYAMAYPKNLSSDTARYFATEVSFSGGLVDKLKAANRLFGTGDIVRSFQRILDDFRPNIVHFHNIHSYLSPIVVKLAHEMGCRVVWTLHDYKLLCPAYNCLCHGKVCEACFTDLTQVLRRKCMKGSAVASALAYGEALWWNRRKLQHWVDTFVCPSAFMAQKMRACGYDYTKLAVINNFLEKEKFDVLSQPEKPEPVAEPYYCYVGRLSEEKGIRLLLDAAQNLPYPLYVAGDGPLAEELRRAYASERIHFLGYLSPQEVVHLVRQARAMVVPSVCYENNPLSIIESLCMGTPVIGSEVGGIPELIREGDGTLFRMGDKEELEEAIEARMSVADTNRQAISKRARARFSEERYWQELKKVYGIEG